MDTYIFIALLRLVDVLLTLYVWTLVAYIVMTWLIAFGIINPYQPLVRMFLRALQNFHDPILAPFRRLQDRFLPDLGGIDLSPLITLLLAQFFVAPLLKDAIILRSINF